MNSEMIDKTEGKFIIYNRGYGCNIGVRITDGEISVVAHWGTKPECTHDLKEHPNWNHAEAMLDSICEYNREEFLNIAKLLKKSSRGYAIIKKIAQKQLVKCDSEISKLIEESEFWKLF